MSSHGASVAAMGVLLIVAVCALGYGAICAVRWLYRSIRAIFAPRPLNHYS